MTKEIEVTAEEIKIHASEKVSTGDYENGNVSATVEASVEGADLTNGMPKELSDRLYGLQRALQNNVKAAAEERQKQAVEKGKL